MDILAVISQEVKTIFSDVVSDASASSEALEAEVLQAIWELGRRKIYPLLPKSSPKKTCVRY